MDAAEVPVSMAQLRGSVATTVAALKRISAVVHQNLSSELAGVVGELDQLRALAEAGLIVATAEAEQRGVIEQSQCASTAAWVRDAAWHLQTGGSAAVAKCVAILRRHDLGSLPDAIRTTDITPIVAVTVAAEYDKVSPCLPDQTRDVVLDLMIDIGSEHGSSAVKQLHQDPGPLGRRRRIPRGARRQETVRGVVVGTGRRWHLPVRAGRGR